MKLLAMTCCCVDVFSPSGTLLPGGNALNIAADWAIQQTRMTKGSLVPHGSTEFRLLGAVGADAYGSAIRQALATLPIDTTHLHTSLDITANHRICVDASGERYFEPDAWTGGAYESFRLSGEDEAFVADSDVVAIAFNDPNLDRVLKLRRQHAFRLAVDFQDAWQPDVWESWLADLDVFFISGDDSKEQTLKAWSLRHPGKPFISTRGADGSALYQAGRTWHQKAVPIERVVDTTGCGDAWLAGYLLASQSGLDTAAAMEAGAEAAAVVIGHIGGFKTAG